MVRRNEPVNWPTAMEIAGKVTRKKLRV